MPTLGRRCRVFILDNRTVMRQGLRAALEKVADLIVVGEADGGPDVLDDIRDVQPDVVVVAEQSGVGAGDVPWIAGGGRLPADVVLLTADGVDADLVYQAIRAGVRGFVSQQSGIDDLVKAIRLVAQGQAVLPPQSLDRLIDFIAQPPGTTGTRSVDERLSAREWEVLNLVARGSTNREIARNLFISESTVRSHIHNILEKLDLTNRVQAAAFVLSGRNAGKDERRSADEARPPARDGGTHAG